VTLKQHTGTTQDNNNTDQRCRNVSRDIENPQHKISTASGVVRESNLKFLETATYVTTQMAFCELGNRLRPAIPSTAVTQQAQLGGYNAGTVRYD
jgi:hypothetical protein